MQKANNSMVVGTSSWLDQFSEAFTVQADDDEEEGEEGEEKNAIMRRLHHALPYSSMETRLCLHSPYSNLRGIPNFWYFYRMDHGCRLLGSSGLGFRSARWQLGILRHHLLYLSSARHCHLDAQKKPSGWWRAWWTQALQDHLSSHICLLLVLLCCYLRSRSLWCHQPRILRRY